MLQLILWCFLSIADFFGTEAGICNQYWVVKGRSVVGELGGCFICDLGHRQDVDPYF